MTYKNLKLITINSVPHIKADNFSTIEVDSSCADDLIDLCYDLRIEDVCHNSQIFYLSLQEGLSIQEADHLIEIRKVKKLRFDNDTVCGYENKAFLLPEKERGITITDAKDMLAHVKFAKTYTLDEIQLEINKVKELFRTNVDAYGKPKSMMKTLDSVITNLKNK